MYYWLCLRCKAVNKEAITLYLASASDSWDCYTGVRSKVTGEDGDLVCERRTLRLPVRAS